MIWLTAASAWACGTFVDAAPPEPVEQSGERVLFRQDADDEWTAFVEVQFSGGDGVTPFVWVIPVRRPFDVATDVSIAPAGLFDALELATSPRFLGPGGDELLPSSMSCDGGVNVGDVIDTLLPDADPAYLLGSSVVGPYALDLIEGIDTDGMLDWLVDQGLTPPDGLDEGLQYYVDEGYDFLGVTLSTSAAGGPVDTLVLGCGMTEPMVPLKLTALAATEAMPITAYVLGDERVSPSGRWKEVHPDLSGVLNTDGYEERLRSEQALAGGRAFTVEYAAAAPKLLEILDRDAADALGHGAYLTRLRAFVDPANMGDDPVFVFDPEAGDVDQVIRPGVDFSGVSTTGGLGLLVLLAAAGVRRR
jgi:MYXO-CTERM domain-containing protein